MMGCASLSEETDQTNMHPSGSESSGLVFWWYAEMKISSPSRERTLKKDARNAGREVV